MPDFTVTELFAKGLPISVQLGASALILALLLGSVLGTIAALNQNKLGDYAVIALAMLVFGALTIGLVMRARWS